MTQNGTVVRLSGVRKTFGTHTAVDDLDLEIESGTIYGLLGPNGSGKTTTIRMMMGILLPDGGAVELFGGPPDFARRSRVGYLPEERGVYEKMKVLDQLVFFGEIRGVGRALARTRAEKWLERLGLSEWASKKVQALSKGMQQKVQFISTVLHDPDLLILDEPFSGLDPVSMRMLRDLILEEHKRGVTILFTTHVMPQAEEICEYIVMVHQGRKVLDEALSTIRSRYDPRAIQFEPLDPDADTRSLMSIPEVESVRGKDRGLEIVLREKTDPAEAMRRIMDRVPAARIELSRPRLEDVFIQLVADGTSADDEQRLRTELQNAEWEGAST